jgi:hypothetical protein
MKNLLLAFALALAVLSGAVVVAAVTSTDVAACPNSSNC